MVLTPGSQLGPYEILAPLGAGGMGEVYRARDCRLDRDVAVKVLPAHLSQDSKTLERFTREMKVLAALSHPNLLAIFDTGTVSGVSYAVTELLHGESLRERLLKGALSWRAVPPELKRVVDHCLEKNPHLRFQSARDLAFQLRAILSTPANTPVSSASHTSNAIDSIAVLPFTNASNDPDTDYLSDGITENILNSLSQVAQLRVTPRSTAFRYKGKDYDPQVLGRELNVRAVLTGRVIQRGETLVVGTELLDVQAGSQLWGERYNRKVSDIFALEEEIARKISDSLRVKLSGEDKKKLAKRFTENTEAYQLYLRGRHYWLRRTPDQVKKALDYFQQAIEKDPGYALAYSGLGDCYSILGVYSILPPKESFARAKAAAAAAVAFDDELAEGHTTLAFIRGCFDWDWDGADKEYQRALELNPGYWVTNYWYAPTLTIMRRFDQAERQIQHGLELEPFSPVIAHGAAMNSLMKRRYDESIQRSLAALANDPSHFLLRMWLGIAYQQEGRHAQAIEELERATELCARNVSWVLGALGSAYATAGKRDEAMAILHELLDRAERETVDCVAPVLVYVSLGDLENAFLWLEKALESRGMVATLISGDPRLDPMRGDPRFHAALKRMNLAAE
jgi:TolB-like protein/Flp pilus assembly protein TadD